MVLRIIEQTLRVRARNEVWSARSPQLFKGWGLGVGSGESTDTCYQTPGLSWRRIKFATQTKIDKVVSQISRSPLMIKKILIIISPLPYFYHLRSKVMGKVYLVYPIWKMSSSENKLMLIISSLRIYSTVYLRLGHLLEAQKAKSLQYWNSNDWEDKFPTGYICINIQIEWRQNYIRFRSLIGSRRITLLNLHIILLVGKNNYLNYLALQITFFLQ